MADHRRTSKFKNDDFEVKIIEESTDKKYILGREEYWIRKYDTFENGLNESWSGKGYGHNSPNFTTSGYTFTDKQRLNMSNSAKKRAVREGFEKRSTASKLGWINGGDRLRKHQSKIRKGKRLRPPIISDEKVEEIRSHFNSMMYENKKSKNGRVLSSSRQFANEFCDYYQMSNTFLQAIVENKVRTVQCPSI